MKIVYGIIMAICLAVFLFSGWKLYGYYRNYHGGRKEYDQLKEYAEETKQEPEENTGKNDKPVDKCPVSVDFAALKKINPQVVGWIWLDDQINYPIVQGEDNDYYLHRTFQGSRNFSGAIFLDYVCRPDFMSDNSIVYGHNLKNGAMFGMLKKYYDTEYNAEADYKKHEVIWIITPERELEYKVFSAREISVVEDKSVYMVKFDSEDSFEDYLKNAVKKSLYPTRNQPDRERRILTLSTCTSTSESGRFVVQATLVQEELKGE
ncbi:MAG: class B sortase [Eubacterium sp.]|nr:class B sortase [Eubacterium sp.]